MRCRRSASMPSTLSAATETGMSCDPRPLIWSTADTNPAAKSAWPATIARGGSWSGTSLIVVLQIPGEVDARWAHLVQESRVECLCGVDAAVLEQMVHRDDFGDDRDVLAGIQWHADL